MKTQIKKWGDSNIIVLSSDFMKFHKANVGDWLDISDSFIVKDKERQEEAKDNLKDLMAKTQNKKREKKIKRKIKNANL